MGQTIAASYDISEKYWEETLKNHLDDKGKVSVIPRKEKKKIVLLSELVKNFETEQDYTEKEVNEVVSQMFNDYASVRRYLVEDGFLSRTEDGQRYWKVSQ